MIRGILGRKMRCKGNTKKQNGKILFKKHQKVVEKYTFQQQGCIKSLKKRQR